MPDANASASNVGQWSAEHPLGQNTEFGASVSFPAS